MTNRITRESAEFIAEELIDIVETNRKQFPYWDIVETIIECLTNEGVIDVIDND